MGKIYKVGILGATGMVGQRFVTLLAEHPLFNVVVVAASSRSCGKSYRDAVSDRWKLDADIPYHIGELIVKDVVEDMKEIAAEVDLVFSAIDLPKSEIARVEEAYAKLECPVVSNNSAHRFTPDVPMVIPEINPDHCRVIPSQRKRLGTKRGFIAVKSNCSLQSYLPPIFPLLSLGVRDVMVSTYQAVSGAGKRLADWPEMQENIIPYIGGEEEKSQEEPKKILGDVHDGIIIPSSSPRISAQCIRVPVENGHLATVWVRFMQKPPQEEILNRWANFDGIPQRLQLPSAPKKPLQYIDEPDRPQTRLDRDRDGGMAITMGRLREDSIFHYKFVCLSHNTLRGAAGGAVLLAELLESLGYLE